MWLEGQLAETGQPARIEVVGERISSISASHDSTAHNRWIAPGLIDIQVNGYASHDVNAPDVSAEVVIALVHSLWRRGVTALCPTVVTQSEERMTLSLRAIADACERDPLVAHSIPYIHMEGPSISPEDGPRGAHPVEHIRPPSLDEYRRWQRASGGRIGIITLAPEHPGAYAYISALTADGVVVALGHTAATEQQITAAVDAGAVLSTHLGNGAHATLPRHPNYLWTQLAEDRLTASLICDGHHLSAPVMKSMLRAKTVERAILISDAVSLAGMPPGVYDAAVGGKVELHPDGRLNLFGTPYLAGSTSSLPECISVVTSLTGVSLSDAVRMATANPARLLHLNPGAYCQSIHVGAPADLTVFDWDPATHDLQVVTTIVRGAHVFQRDTP